MKITLTFIALSLSAHLAGAAEFPEDYSKILLPIVIQEPASGAFGSQWVTHVAITNTGAQPVALEGYDFPSSCQILCPRQPTPDVLPNVTFHPEFFEFSNSNGIAPHFLYVERGRQADIHVGLRVQDISRQAETWGTELPVVPEAAFQTTAIVLEDIPLSAGFRSNLRVYDLDSVSSHSARIRLYAVEPGLTLAFGAVPTDPLLLDRTISFSSGDLYTPGMIYLDLSSLPELSGAQVVRAEVTPGDGNPLQFWALASTTHNTTQHVTTFSPR
jgi:hypothetical protein